ncbi:NAD(P)-dependent oxidoreductase [Natrinema salsiterrestre]|uniref:NAD(P)H-binding protein n=1 Tax=Natrinema salsiterrestre TaxID=2950540 RepID=A0A9Q4Q4G6_9EURY|nr:NAD(P)H-binding protein [Natrinema salsiterrestre]MDF9748561.1 NAD(P)H-binding protein [Natrinema salsiterrestre]
MKLTVFGATGRTGRPLCRQALERGHEVVVHVRSPEKVPFADDVAVVEGDAYTGSGVPEAVADADAVVSVLGQTDGSPDDLLTVAGDHILAAAADAGVDRFVTLVGAGVREEGESISLGGRVMGALLKLLARSTLEDAAIHVERVRRTDLAWTVVRAPRLGEGDPAGDYRAGDIALGFEAIDRADVARFILDCLEEDRYVREMPKVGPV